MMYLTPRTLPIFESLAALGSARSLCAKSCSASTVSSFLRSITRNVPSFDQRVHDLVGHALADVVVAPPVVDRAEVEVHDRHGDALGALRAAADRRASSAAARPPPRPATSFSHLSHPPPPGRNRKYAECSRARPATRSRRPAGRRPCAQRPEARAAPRTAPARAASASRAGRRSSEASRSPRPPRASSRGRPWPRRRNDAARPASRAGP